MPSGNYRHADLCDTLGVSVWVPLLSLDDTHFFPVCAVLCRRSGPGRTACCKISFLPNGSSAGDSSGALLLAGRSGQTTGLLTEGPGRYWESHKSPFLICSGKLVSNQLYHKRPAQLESSLQSGLWTESEAPRALGLFPAFHGFSIHFCPVFTKWFLAMARNVAAVRVAGSRVCSPEEKELSVPLGCQRYRRRLLVGPA